ncbi:transglycosylase SLT domain-containing protein [Propionispira raffinosivorans]|uniref:transglycosylase SLT domain-containing protein n=1 Tax=Propionispira raffinosivorans TaxID=86959 RepID=UPI000379872F|nr:transglycosylase SLT domain-containing protein [Propionispira raffinosivorans]
MRIKQICIAVVIFICLSMPATFAEAPFSGGEVTAPFGEENHMGHMHKGIDIGTASGTPILAPFGGNVERGAGNGFIYWVLITGENGESLLFGDCNPDTLICPDGTVVEGSVIGYTGGDAYDGELGTSTGAHCHVEYWPSGYYTGSVIDPYSRLVALGVNLSGDGIINPGSGQRGSDNISLPWGVETMYQMGDSLNQLMEQMVTALSKGYSGLQRAGLALLFVLAILDLTLPILVAGLETSLNQVITKIFKYGFLFLIFTNWQRIINDFFLSFVSSVSGTFIQDSTVIADNVSQPQLLMQKCVYMITPGLNKIASFGSMDFVRNFSMILPIYLITFLTMGIFFFLSCYIMLVYIEFYLSSSVVLCTGPFAALGFTKFVAEGSLGHLVSTTIKLMILSVMVGLCIFCIKDAKPQDVFTMKIPAVTQTGTGSVSGPANLVDIATGKAQKYNIPVTLFLAQIQAESSWNSQAVSEAGAEGLGQLMPATAVGLGCYDPFNPEQNLEASAKYMEGLYEQFGDWNYALAAYNGGPNSISKNEPLPGWAQAYVNQVNANLSGSYTVNNGITAEAMSKYILLCLSLIGLAILTFRVPKSIMNALGGRYELS